MTERMKGQSRVARSLACALGLAVFLAGCMGTISRPCEEGGEPARETPFRGDRRCSQKRGPDGKYVNNGLYQEWYPDGTPALKGYYKMGKKEGYWTWYDHRGRKTKERYFEDGIEVPPKKP